MNKFRAASYFDGGILSYIGLKILTILLTIFTLGFGIPWAIVLEYRWEINNTVLNGHQLRFTGTGLGLFGHWVKWWFFTLITLGIYGFWLRIKLLDWKASHTQIV